MTDSGAQAATTATDFTDGDLLESLRAPIAAWLPAQRWFAGKARQVATITVTDTARLDARVANLFVEVAYTEGDPETYQVPVALLDGRPDAAAVIHRFASATVVDALADERACQLLAALAARGGRRHTRRGFVMAGHAVTDRAPGAGDHPRPLQAEQSNSSVVFGRRYILKLFRRLEQGVNPDVELTAGLTQSGFAHVPAQHAAMLLAAPGNESTALAVLSDFIADSVDGWALGLQEVSAVAQGSDPAPATPVLDHLGELGAVLAGAHATLGRVFGAHEVSEQDLGLWVDQMHRQADQVLGLAAASARGPAGSVLARWSQIHERFDELRRLGHVGSAVRIHGDLHLGQVLMAPGRGWQLLDFEGEPARPLRARRERQPGLRDVAGMLRSFDYAAAAGAAAAELREDPSGQLAAPALHWRDQARTRLLDGYRAAIEPELAPGSPAVQDALLDALELHKAVYELGYELANRPSWVPIPMGGILRILER